MRTQDSHIAAARYYAATGMHETAARELERAKRAKPAPVKFQPSKRDAAAMRAALAAYRYGKSN